MHFTVAAGRLHMGCEAQAVGVCAGMFQAAFCSASACVCCICSDADADENRTLQLPGRLHLQGDPPLQSKERCFTFTQTLQGL